jgi:hypothetical protein
LFRFHFHLYGKATINYKSAESAAIYIVAYRACQY